MNKRRTHNNLQKKGKDVNREKGKEKVRKKEMEAVGEERGRYVRKGVLIIGIDIGKAEHEQIGTALNEGYTKSFRFSNNKKGFEDAERMIRIWKEQFKCDEVLIGYESTGHYWKPLIYYLQDKGYKTVQVSAKFTNKVKELMDNSPSKNDKKSAIIIADLVKQGKVLNSVIPKEEMIELREYMKIYKDLTKEYAALCNKIIGIQDITFPERSEIIKNIDSKTSLYLFEKAPFPSDIIEKGLEWLTEQMKRISRGRFGDSEAAKLYSYCKETIGIKRNLEPFRYALETLLNKLYLVQKQLKQTEDKISIILKDIEESRYIKSIKGLGEAVIGCIISETGGLKNFKKSKQLIKYAGLTLYACSSGKSKGKERITRRGRSFLRKMIYLAALQQTRKGMPLYYYYQRLLENKQPKQAAIIAVARKLLCIIFSLVKNKTYYKNNNLIKTKAA